MDLNEVKACLRGLLSSTAASYNLNALLYDFKEITGLDLPLFGYLHPVEFLRTLDDTVRLIGDLHNPEVALIESQKSSHIISLVERQKKGSVKRSHRNSKPKLYGHGQLKAEYLRCDAARIVVKNPKVKTPKMAVRCNYASTSREKTTTFSYPPRNHDDLLSVSYPSDISDDESGVSIDERVTGTSSTMTEISRVNDSMKAKLQALIQNYPEGLWCCDAPGAFRDMYSVSLEFKDFGYTSLIQMFSELPDVFRCVRPVSGDWILFNASEPESIRERSMLNIQKANESGCNIGENLKVLLTNYFEHNANTGISLDKIKDLYEQRCGTLPNYKSLGLEDFKTLLTIVGGRVISLFDIEGKTYAVPAVKRTIHPRPQWREALQPITPQDDLFTDIFPANVVGSKEQLPELDLIHHLGVNRTVRIAVAEVWDPGYFYLQLYKFQTHFIKFMDELQEFYEIHMKRYKMPESTILPTQVCAALYRTDPECPDEWHRGVIVKVINDKLCLVKLVDFGTTARIKKTHLRFLHKNFRTFPVQGFQARMHGIQPPKGESTWPLSSSKRFLKLVQVQFLDAKVIHIDFKKPLFSVVLTNPTQKPVLNVGDELVANKLAELSKFDNEIFIASENSQPKPGNNEDEKSMDSKGVNKNEPQLKDEFSDIDDFSESTLLKFKMKTLDLNESGPCRGDSGVQKNSENLRSEFEEVSDSEIIKEGRENEGEPSMENAKNENLSGREDNNKVKDLKRGSEAPLTLELEPVPGLSAIQALRKPPGLENVNVEPDVTEIYTLLQCSDLQQKINQRVMEIMSTNANIKEVGHNNLALALQLAKDIAEASVAAELSGSSAVRSPVSKSP